MTPELIFTYSAIITSLGVIVGLIYSLFKFAKRIDSALGVDKDGRTLSERLDKVEHQLWENGGGSLADRVNNIELHVIKVSTEISFIKDITLGLRNSQASSIATGLVPKIEKPIAKTKAVKKKPI